MSSVYFEDRERQQLLDNLLEHWCKDYEGFQRRQMEEVLLRNLKSYPTDKLQAVINDIAAA